MEAIGREGRGETSGHSWDLNDSPLEKLPKNDYVLDDAQYDFSDSEDDEVMLPRYFACDRPPYSFMIACIQYRQAVTIGEAY
ncbi:hypothetical protein GOP47_0012100 [Adiantum capillus-veneris]|uniref:Uncharacterized protein n=1 Tax=Adiantum capillus-veneris TaxID=13818 RepID=A0A9D4ZE57_ADICA|nr:hypothetical protein GOP47_0012100 [Adiantum capillus-veneris]